jgi:hypothetical protein
MVSKAKLYIQLDRLQDELCERIIPHLQNAAKGNNALIFCTLAFNSIRKLQPEADQETEKLIQLGRQVLALSDKLGVVTKNSIAERLCWYCRKWEHGNDTESCSSQILAQTFLQEIINAKE